MAVIALGGYFGSRLMLNIREDKGYTYGISAGTRRHCRKPAAMRSSRPSATTATPVC